MANGGNVGCDIGDAVFPHVLLKAHLCWFDRSSTPSTNNALSRTQRGYEIPSTPSGAHAALSAYTAQQQTYTHTLMLKSEAVRPSAHIWSGLALVQISPNQTLRTLFHTSSSSLPLPLQYVWPRRARSFHPHSHGNSFSLAWGKRQTKVQLAGFTLEILFITLAATLISPSVVLPLSLSGGSLLNIFPVLKFMDFSSVRTYIPFPVSLPILHHHMEIAFLNVKSTISKDKLKHKAAV